MAEETNEVILFIPSLEVGKGDSTLSLECSCQFPGKFLELRVSFSFGRGQMAKKHYIEPRWVGWFTGPEPTGYFPFCSRWPAPLISARHRALHGEMERSLGKSQTTWILILPQLLAGYVSLTMCPCLSFLKWSLRRMNGMFSFRLTKIWNYVIISHRMNSSWLASGNVSCNVISQNHLSSQDALETNLSPTSPTLFIAKVTTSATSPETALPL